MMTKDKKPFTYTPGGIDLSQIKSERMAKRLARNAQAEGVGSAQQQNRPLQPQSPGSGSPVASIGAAALGMPFQVLPTAQAAPGAIAGKNTNGGNAPAPPPPPPPSSNLLPASSLGVSANSSNVSRKSPTQQTQFEPPPIGFRPEIKIPSNPMAALRKVPPPIEKNNFWKDEYVKEHSKSPMRESGNDLTDNNDYNAGNNYHQTRCNQMNNNHNTDGSKNSTAISPVNGTNQYQQTPNANINNNAYVNYQQPQQQQFASSLPSQPTTPQPYVVHSPSTPGQQLPTSKPEFRSVAPPQPPSVSVYTRQSDSPRIQLDNETSPQSSFNKYSQQQQGPGINVSPSAQQQITSPSSGTSASPTQTIPWRAQRNNQQQTSQKPLYNNNVQQQQSDNYNNTQSPKPTNVGSLYIAPLTPPNEPQAQHIVRQQMLQQTQQQQQQRQSQQPTQQLRWLTSQPAAREQPEWARPDENGNVVPSTINRVKSPLPSSLTTNTAEQQQPIYNNGMQNFGSQSSHVSPEQTPTNNPGQLNFNSQPTTTNNAPGYIMRTPNQFVDQGYNSYVGQQFSGQQQHQQHQQQQQQQQQHVISSIGQQLNAPRMVIQQQQQASAPRTHIIPIAIEGNEGTRGPVSKTPIVIQNDQRTPPVQSKSFRILQKITDTIGEGNANMKDSTAATMRHRPDNYVDAEPQLQKPQFARQMSAQQARNSLTVEQMRRLQIAHEKDFNEIEQHIPPSEQQVAEPKKYTGSAIPSRSFKILQAMTAPENAATYNSQQCKEINDERNHIHNLSTTRCHSLPPNSTMPTSYPNYCDYDCHWHHQGHVTNWHYIQILSQSLENMENCVLPLCYAPYHHPFLTYCRPSVNLVKPTSDLDLKHQVCTSCFPSLYSPCSNSHASHPYMSRPESRNFRRARSVLPDIIITPSEDFPDSQRKIKHDSVRSSSPILEYKSLNPQKNCSINSSDQKLTDNTTTSSVQQSYEKASERSDVNNIQNYYTANPKSFNDVFNDDFTISETSSEEDDDEDDEEDDVEDEDENIPEGMNVNAQDSVQTEDSLEDENLSIIQEEKSELERNRDYTKAGSNDLLQTIKISDQNHYKYGKPIERNDNDEREQSASVTVRLPLKFRFRRSFNDANIATVEVGNSEIEDQKDSILLDKTSNCLEIKSENDNSETEIDNSYNVSVTLPLKSSIDFLKNNSSSAKSPIIQLSVDKNTSSSISASPELEDIRPGQSDL
uniref:Uncharacterized protein n=1 Tax=Glossina brevipalpis TaxID=37001 RepID=A0A1A9WXI3_9MUSC